MESVYVLHIHHRHGHDYQVHATRDGANQSLAEYCREWWTDGAAPDQDLSEFGPDDHDAIVSLFYGDGLLDEWADIEQCPIQRS